MSKKDSKEPKPLNVGQQPNDSKTQKIFATALEAKNIGIDKVLLNINGGNSELETNKNAIIKYSLKQPIQLEVGDIITCTNAFVEEKGLAENTISFEEDIEAEMRFMYYKQGDPGDESTNLEDVGFCAYPKVYPDLLNPVGPTKNNRVDLVYNYVSSGGAALYNQLVGDCCLNMSPDGLGYVYKPGGTAAPTDAQSICSGPNGNYYYLAEAIEFENNAARPEREYIENYWIRPCYGKKRIKVKAGNYSVDSLANIISAQLNGSIGLGDNPFSNSLLDKIYGSDSGINTCLPFFKDITVEGDTQDVDVLGPDNGMKDGYRRNIVGLCKQLNYSSLSYYECWAYQNLLSELTGTVATRYAISLFQGQIPNAEPLFTPTKNFQKEPQADAEPPSIKEMLRQEGNYNDGTLNTHFYMNPRTLRRLYETPDRFYSVPGLKTSSFDFNDPVNSPVDLLDVCSNTVNLFDESDRDKGFIPENGGFGSFRSFGVNQTLWPVNGFAFPGRRNLIPQRQKFAGTSVAEVTFGDSVSNRFALSNFHEFYKLPNLTPDAKTTTGYGGQQATKYNNPFSNSITTGGVTDNKAFLTQGSRGGVYPIDSSSGIAIQNFDFDLVKNTKTYIDLTTEIKQMSDLPNPSFQQMLYKEQLVYQLFTKPFDQFFDTEEDAKTAWSKSLWSRLGFSYNQLGDITKHLEQFTPVANLETKNNNQPQVLGAEPQKQYGLITHNDFDFSKIVSSDGLGVGNPVINANGTPFQNYRISSYFFGKALPNNVGLSGNNIHLMTNSKPINAENLPSLNDGNSYLLIESDIVKPNFKDNKANWGNLLAVMSKENSSNDTIYGAQPIDFTVTEPRLLSDITLYIKNPDGTLASNDIVGKNSGFIIQISKAIPPQKLPSLF